MQYLGYWREKGSEEVMTELLSTMLENLKSENKAEIETHLNKGT